MKRDKLIEELEGKYFRNGNGKELHIVMGGYITGYGAHVRLSNLCACHKRAIAKCAYDKSQNAKQKEEEKDDFDTKPQTN